MPRRLTILVLTASVLLLGALTGPSLATDERVEAATAVAQTWLELVDSGRYDESWQESAALFRAQVSAEQWAQAVRTARGPLGDLVERSVQSATHYTELPGAPDGEYVVIVFRTRFANKASATETVTPMLDDDGEWRVSGYYVK